MVQVTPEVHTPWKLGVVLSVLVLLGAGVGFWWFVTNSNTAHEARLAAIDKQAVLGLFDTAFYAGDLDRAATQALIISETYPDDVIGSVYAATAHLQAATMWFDEQERLPVIEQELSRAQTMSPQNAEVLRLLGHAYLLAANNEQALQAFDEAISGAATSTLPRVSRGFAFIAQERFDDARADFTGVLESTPTQASALLGEAELLLRLESEESLEPYVDRVFDATSNRLLYARILAVRGAAEYSQERYDAALTTFYDALEYDAQNYDAALGVLMSELALAVNASLPPQSAIDAMHETVDTVERLYSGSAQLALARGVLASLQNQQRDRRAAYDQAIALLDTDRSLLPSDVVKLRSQLERAQNSTELFTPPFFLSTRVPLEHCVTCGQ